MRPTNLLRLLLLGAIWGGSFICMRLAAPVLPPLWVTLIRVGLGALTLLIAWRLRGQAPGWVEHWRVCAVIGIFNTALPFTLFAWSAARLPAAYMAVCNAMAPMFTALVAGLWLREALTRRRAVAMGLGLVGVGLVVRLGPNEATPALLAGLAAALLAALSYGFAANYTRARAAALSGPVVALGSQCAALPLLALGALVTPVPDVAPVLARGEVLLALAVLGVVCTGVAYAIFFQLIATEGANRAITVTYLVPVSASLWSVLLLGERLTAGMMAGMALVLLAVALANGLSWQALSARLRRSPS